MAFEDDFLADLDPRRWTAPDGTPKSLTTAGLFLGGGDHPLEVALATSPHRPKAEDARKLWHARQGKRPRPLVLIIGYPDHGGTRLTVCGPVGEQPPLLNDLEVSQVERLAAAALAEPNRHAAIRFLVAMLPEVGADLPGVRNTGLVATQELRSGVPQRADWSSACCDSAPLLPMRGRQLVEKLGFSVEPLSVTSSVLTVPGGTKRAVAVFLDEGETTYEGATVTEPLPMTRHESIDSFAGRMWSVDRPAVLGDKASWVQAVLDWTTIAPRLDKVERPSYVAWHAAGRQVLKMVTTTKRLTIVAGVDSKHPGKWPPSVKQTLEGPADDHVLHAIIAAAAQAASARLAGADSAHREHQMQAVLDPEDVGLAEGWMREFPAWRPGSNRAGYIDFLAKDVLGRLHVVETKIGADTMLILQGLDYWLWCRANSSHASAAVGASSSRPPVIDFLVAPADPGGEPISIYTAAQAESLDRDIEWRFIIVGDPDQGRDIETLTPYRIPDPHRRAGEVPARWAVWVNADSELPIPDPDGDGSRVITTDLSRVDLGPSRDVATQLRDELPRLSAQLQRRLPWWMAPWADLLYWQSRS